MVIGSESSRFQMKLKMRIIAVKIPGMGKAESLNAGVATGIMLHEMING